jgi:DNA-binding IclR family transcriptional regulator
MVDVLSLPEPSRRLMTALTRLGGGTLAEIAAQASAEEDTASALLDALAADGYVEITHEDGASRYQATVGHRQARRAPSALWKALE